MENTIAFTKYKSRGIHSASSHFTSTSKPSLLPNSLSPLPTYSTTNHETHTVLHPHPPPHPPHPHPLPNRRPHRTPSPPLSYPHTHLTTPSAATKASTSPTPPTTPSRTRRSALPPHARTFAPRRRRRRNVWRLRWVMGSVCCMMRVWRRF